MANSYTTMLLVSANVGSIFEDPDKMLQLWLDEFLATVRRVQPGFLAIHCQEVGGKNYEESMQHVNSFVKALFAAESMQNYDRSRFFLDEDFTAVDQFTALGNIYFVHNSVEHVQIYDFDECQFVRLEGREVLSGNIASVPIKEKAKFPQEFFPDFKWSRKGFIRTRWNLQNSIFDLVNIHLFHDASNIVAMESSPSQYSANRGRTLKYTLERFNSDKYEKVPQFMFGDFNFRLDTHKLVRKLTEGTEAEHIKGKKGDISKIIYKDKHTNEAVLTLEKKGFDLPQSKETFLNNNGHWVHQFDREALPFRDKLLEYDITFPPTYPFSEDVEEETCYNKTRCPAWCDRILFTPKCRSLFYDDKVEYSMMGTNICMGDHKPIYLLWRLRHNTALISREDVEEDTHAQDKTASAVCATFLQSQPLSPHSPARTPPSPAHSAYSRTSDDLHSVHSATSVLTSSPRRRRTRHSTDSSGGVVFSTHASLDTSLSTEYTTPPSSPQHSVTSDSPSRHVTSRQQQVRITQIDSTRYIHVRQGSGASSSGAGPAKERVFRETTV